MNDLEKYVDARPLDIQKKLNQILSVLRKSAPGANEGLKYGKPSLYYKRVLIIFSEYKTHIGFYPTPLVIEHFLDKLKDFKTSKGAIQFPLDKPLPIKLIKEMADYRVKLYNEDDAKWKTK